MLEQAWFRWCDELKSAGAKILSRDLADSDQAEGLRWLTRMTRFGLEAGIEHSDPCYPAFFKPTHETIKVMSDNPDAQHFMAAIRDDMDYVLRGRHGNEARIMFTIQGRMPEGGMTQLSGLGSSELKYDPDGSFTIHVSRKPKGNNWLPLIGTAQSLLARVLSVDCDRKVAPVLQLDRAAAVPPPAVLGGAELARRLDMARQITLGSARNIQAYGNELRAKGWINCFGEDAKTWSAGDPGVHYWHGTWKLAEDEALIVEIDPPRCFFWNFQINNRWAESLDYVYRHVHINTATAVHATDGRVRAIMTHCDPGFPNWLDTTGHDEGTMLIRTIDGEARPSVHTRIAKRDQLAGEVR